MVTLEEIFPYVYAIFPYVIAPVIVFSIQYIITKTFEFKDRKKKKSIWIKFLRKTNGIINESLSKFEKIESTNNKWIEFSKPVILLLAFSLIFIIFFIIFMLSRNLYISLAFAGFIISIFISLLGLILDKYTSDKIKEGNLLNKSNKIKDFYSFINWFFLGIISFILPAIYETIVISNQIPIYDLEKIRLLYFSSIIMIISTMIVLSINFPRLFFGKLKFEINKLYSEDFPKVHISTSVEILNGKIHYIFDDDLIILDDVGVIKGTQWNDIIVITINNNPIS